MGKLDDAVRQRIRKWIDGAGISDKEFGDKIGRNGSWVSRWFDGQFDADLDTVQGMARAFDHSLYELLNEPEGSQREQDLIEDYRALRAEARDVAFDAIRLMLPAAKRARTRKRDVE